MVNGSIAIAVMGLLWGWLLEQTTPGTAARSWQGRPVASPAAWHSSISGAPGAALLADEMARVREAHVSDLAGVPTCWP